MKKDQWYGKVSVHEYNGQYHFSLDMPRKEEEAEMFFIIDWLLQPWYGKNVKIIIQEVDKFPVKKEKKLEKNKLPVQEEWAKKFWRMGVV